MTLSRSGRTFTSEVHQMRMDRMLVPSTFMAFIATK